MALAGAFLKRFAVQANRDIRRFLKRTGLGRPLTTLSAGKCPPCCKTKSSARSCFAKALHRRGGFIHHHEQVYRNTRGNGTPVTHRLKAWNATSSAGRSKPWLATVDGRQTPGIGRQTSQQASGLRIEVQLGDRACSKTPSAACRARVMFRACPRMNCGNFSHRWLLTPGQITGTSMTWTCLLSVGLPTYQLGLELQPLAETGRAFFLNGANCAINTATQGNADGKTFALDNRLCWFAGWN